MIWLCSGVCSLGFLGLFVGMVGGLLIVVFWCLGLGFGMVCFLPGFVCCIDCVWVVFSF